MTTITSNFWGYSRQQENSVVKAICLLYYVAHCVSANELVKPQSNLLALNHNSDQYSSNNEADDDGNVSRSSCIETENCKYDIENLNSNLSENYTVHDSKLIYSPFQTVVIILGYTIVFIVGFVGNLVVVCVIILRSHMKTVTNVFILNLAVADGFVLLFCLPATLIASVWRPWILGSVMCHGVTYVQGVSVIASAYSLVAISVDRCKAICYPSMAKGGLTQRQAKSFIIGIWMISLILPFPWIFVFQLHYPYSPDEAYCWETWNNEFLDKFYFLIFILICGYLLPLLIIFIANLLIWWKVSRRKMPHGCSSRATVTLNTSNTSSNQMSNSTRTSRKKKGVGRMLGAVTLTYLISWLPLYVIGGRMKLAVSISETENNVLISSLPAAQWLAYWNSCVNPVLYAFLNSDFRKMSKSLFPAWFLEKFLKGEIIENDARRVSIRFKTPDGNERVEFVPTDFLDISDYSINPNNGNKSPVQHEAVLNGGLVVTQLRTCSHSKIITDV